MPAQRSRAALAQHEAPSAYEVERPDFDFVDMLWGFPVAVSAAHLNIPAVAVTALAFVAQKAARTNPAIKAYAGEALGFALQLLPMPDGMRQRLPAPRHELSQDVDEDEDRALAIAALDHARQRYIDAPPDDTTARAKLERIENQVRELYPDLLEENDILFPPLAPNAPLIERLERLPRRVDTSDIRPWPQSRTAIPVGRSDQGQPLWLDLAADAPNAALHVGLYGQSGCGKDSLLRVWYTALCKRNSPQDVRFAIIDGKGDWLTDGLAHQPHMFIAPAGGYGGIGEMRIKQAVLDIDAEAERRQDLITSANCRTREEYIRKTGRPMPILVVAATDVMTSVKDEVEDLLVNLVSKARSLGIRVVVSMQTPSGKDTKWRMNLSTVIAGNLQAGSQDTPALGIEARDMRVRPSQLPSPQERPGVFVVKRGGEQHLVQAVYLPEDKFDAMCAQLAAPVVAARPASMPAPAALGDTERLPKVAPAADALLADLLASAPPKQEQPTATATISRDGLTINVNASASAPPAAPAARGRSYGHRGRGSGANIRGRAAKLKGQRKTEVLEEMYARLHAEGVPSFRQAYILAGNKGSKDLARAAWNKAAQSQT